MPITYVKPDEVKDKLSDFDAILDVRRRDEWNNGHLELPSVRFVENLHACPEKVAELEDLEHKKVLVHCAAGKRAKMAGEMLEHKIADLFVVVDGGFSHIKT